MIRQKNVLLNNLLEK